jgi:hypothetical protein
VAGAVFLIVLLCGSFAIHIYAVVQASQTVGWRAAVVWDWMRIRVLGVPAVWLANLWVVASFVALALWQWR